jgi:hypothetical protein
MEGCETSHSDLIVLLPEKIHRCLFVTRRLGFKPGQEMMQKREIPYYVEV